MERVTDQAKAGQGVGAESSVLKYYGTEMNKRRNELNLAALGEQALGWDGDEYRGGVVSRGWLRSKGNSIEGGTTEINLNLIAIQAFQNWRQRFGLFTCCCQQRAFVLFVVPDCFIRRARCKRAERQNDHLQN